MFTTKSLSVSLFCLSCWLCFLSPSLAQINSEDSANYQSNEYDSTNSPGGLNPLDLIHRANMGTLRSSQEFQSDTEEKLDNAASDFKLQQQELLQNPSQTQSE